MYVFSAVRLKWLRSVREGWGRGGGGGGGGGGGRGEEEVRGYKLSFAGMAAKSSSATT